MSELPPLPPGFVLDVAPQAGAVPPLPAGFTLDAPRSGGNAITDIWPEIKAAGSAAISAMDRNLNPFSAERQADTLRRSQATEPTGMESVLSVGKGLMGAPELLASPITGAARSVIGHGLEATGQFSYDEGKAAADKAMMGLRPSGKFTTITTPAGPQSQLIAPNGTVIGNFPGAAATKSVEYAPPSKPAATPATLDLKAEAGAGYQRAEAIGVEFHPAVIQNATQKIAADLAKNVNPSLAPKTFGTLEGFDKIPQGPNVTIADFRTMQRQLGTAAGSIDPTERMAAMAARNALNAFVEKLTPNHLAKGTTADLASALHEIRQANANYTAYNAAKVLDEKTYKAELGAGAANSGANTENKLRQAVTSVLTNQKLRRRYTPAQIKMMEDFVNGKLAGNALRAVGNILGGGGGWSTLINGIIGHTIGGPVGAVLEPAIGVAVKQAGNRRALNQIRAINEAVRGNSPFAQSLPPQQFPPSPLLGSIFPYGLPQSFPLLLGAMPARADDE